MCKSWCGCCDPLRGVVHSCSCFVSLIFRLPIVVVAHGRNDSFWDTCQRMGNCWERFRSGTTSVTWNSSPFLFFPIRVVLLYKVSTMLKWGATMKTCLSAWLEAHFMKGANSVLFSVRTQARSHWRPMHWQKRRPLDKYSCWNHAASFAGSYNPLVDHFLGLFNFVLI